MCLARERRNKGVDFARVSQSWSKTAVVGMETVSGRVDYRNVAEA
jgi:hypothetical protein